MVNYWLSSGCRIVNKQSICLLIFGVLNACGGGSSAPPNASATPTPEPTTTPLPEPSIPPSSGAPADSAAPHLNAFHSWMHSNGEVNTSTAVAQENIRQSAFYEVTVSTGSSSEEAFTYMSIPRSGKGKQGYNHDDGAEFADQSNLTMSWTSFLYQEDVSLRVDLLNGLRIGSIDEIQIRPTTLNFQLEYINDTQFSIQVPYSETGYRFSVEIENDLVTSYSDLSGISGRLSEDENGALIHTEPRNALLVFAEPSLSQDQRTDLIPSETDGDIYYPEEGLIDYLENVETDIIYFKPGIYFISALDHLYFHEQVRWVYLAPGAYIKGAFEFRGENTDYKVTGYGVLSGEAYVYEADRSTEHNHTAYTHRSDSASDCHGSCVKLLQYYSTGTRQSLLLHGVTLVEPPYHSFVVFGESDSFTMDIAQYKQVGAWYWQTDGMELYQDAVMQNSFVHANDDVLKLYHSNVNVENITVWKSENGPVFQWGWTPRAIENISVNDIDIIHNRMYWKDQKHNTCIFNAAKHWNGSDNAGDPAQLIRNLSFHNIRAEGNNLCAMRFYPLSNWQDISITNFSIENLTEMPSDSSYSHFDVQWNTSRSEKTSVSNFSLVDYQVLSQGVDKDDDSWRSSGLGRLNFSVEVWNGWDAQTNINTCTPQSIDFSSISKLSPNGSSVTLNATSSSGLPVNFRLLSGNLQLTGQELSPNGTETNGVVQAFQGGTGTFCESHFNQEVIVGD